MALSVVVEGKYREEEIRKIRTRTDRLKAEVFHSVFSIFFFLVLFPLMVFYN